MRKQNETLIDEIWRNLQPKPKGLPTQKKTKKKNEIKSMYDNNHNHGETIKDIEKETSYLKGELVISNQLLSNFRNKNLTCFLQGDAFPRKPT